MNSVWDVSRREIDDYTEPYKRDSQTDRREYQTGNKTERRRLLLRLTPSLFTVAKQPRDFLAAAGLSRCLFSQGEIRAGKLSHGVYELFVY